MIYNIICVSLRLALISVIIILVGCADNSCRHLDSALNRADTLMEELPDSSYEILRQLDTGTLISPYCKARYSLLLSKSMDRTYRDATDFSNLQPAIDYFLKHGTPDERFQTLYYQGCIYENMGQDKEALIHYLKAYDTHDVKDTIMIARCLTAQANLLGELFDYRKYYDLYLRAGDLYGTRGRRYSQLNAYNHAFNAAMILHDRQSADSLRKIMVPLLKSQPDFYPDASRISLAYSMAFGDNDSIRQCLEFVADSIRGPFDCMLIAEAHHVLSEDQIALEYLRQVDTTFVDDNLKYRYFILGADANYRLGNFEETAQYYRKYLYKSESEDARLRGNGLQMAETIYTYEKEKIEALRSRDRVIILVLAVAVVVLIIALVVVLWFRRQKIQLRDENEAIIRRFDVIIGEYEDISARYRQIGKELDIAYAQRRDAEDENRKTAEIRNRLEESLVMQRKMMEEVLRVTDERMRLLNDIITKEIITSLETARELVESDPMYDVSSLVHGDIKEFMDSTRRVYKVLYPNFIEPLEKNGLSNEEISLACLYTLGLSGKQIKAYTGHGRHYHTASDIRAKLGLSKGMETSLGRYFLRNFRELYPKQY